MSVMPSRASIFWVCFPTPQNSDTGWLRTFAERQRRESGRAIYTAVLRAPGTGEIVAFANLLRGAGVELSVDLMRYRPDGPKVAMDALFAEIMLWAAARGFACFSLGAAPFSGTETHALASPWQRIGSFVFEHGEAFYHFEGLRSYKQKFAPTWSPNYLACERGLGVVRAFLDANSLISGR